MPSFGSLVPILPLRSCLPRLVLPIPYYGSSSRTVTHWLLRSTFGSWFARSGCGCWLVRLRTLRSLFCIYRFRFCRGYTCCSVAVGSHYRLYLRLYIHVLPFVAHVRLPRYAPFLRDALVHTRMPATPPATAPRFAGCRYGYGCRTLPRLLRVCGVLPHSLMPHVTTPHAHTTLGLLVCLRGLLNTAVPAVATRAIHLLPHAVVTVAIYAFVTPVYFTPLPRYYLFTVHGCGYTVTHTVCVAAVGCIYVTLHTLLPVAHTRYHCGYVYYAVTVVRFCVPVRYRHVACAYYLPVTVYTDSWLYTFCVYYALLRYLYRHGYRLRHTRFPHGYVCVLHKFAVAFIRSARFWITAFTFTHTGYLHTVPAVIYGSCYTRFTVSCGCCL